MFNKTSTLGIPFIGVNEHYCNAPPVRGGGGSGMGVGERWVQDLVTDWSFAKMSAHIS